MPLPHEGKFGIKEDSILTHAQVSPGRKDDVSEETHRLVLARIKEIQNSDEKTHLKKTNFNHFWNLRDLLSGQPRAEVQWAAGLISGLCGTTISAKESLMPALVNLKPQNHESETKTDPHRPIWAPVLLLCPPWTGWQANCQRGSGGH